MFLAIKTWLKTCVPPQYVTSFSLSHLGSAELAVLPSGRPRELRHEAEHHPLPRQRDQPRGDAFPQVVVLQARTLIETWLEIGCRPINQRMKLPISLD